MDDDREMAVATREAVIVGILAEGAGTILAAPHFPDPCFGTVRNISGTVHYVPAGVA
jgi:hypothetical protein